MRIWHSKRDGQGKGNKNKSDLDKLIFLAGYLWIIPCTNLAEAIHPYSLPTSMLTSSNIKTPNNILTSYSSTVANANNQSTTNKTSAQDENYSFSLASLLLADIALHRNETKIAAKEYLNLAIQQNKALFAEQATLAAIQNLDLTFAFQAATEWVKLAPGSIAANYFVSMLAIQEQSPDTEKNLINLFANSPKYTLKLAKQLEDSISSKKSMQQWQTIISEIAKEQPDNSALLFLSAQFKCQQNQLADALQQINQVLQKKPNFVEAVILKSQILAKQNSKDAFTFIEEAIQHNPSSIDLEFEKANLYFRTNQNDLGLKLIATITAQYKNVSNVQIQAAEILIHHLYLADARFYLESLLKTDPQNNNARYLMGEISEKQSRLNEALDWFLSISENSGDYIEARLNAAKLFNIMDAPKEALQVLDKIIPISPFSIQKWLLIRIDALILKKQFREANRWVEKGLILFPNNETLLKMKNSSL